MMGDLPSCARGAGPGTCCNLLYFPLLLLPLPRRSRAVGVSRRWRTPARTTARSTASRARSRAHAVQMLGPSEGEEEEEEEKQEEKEDE